MWKLASLTFVVLAVPTATSQGVGIEFGSPAELSGEIELMGGTWLAVFFAGQPAERAKFEVQATGSYPAQNTTYSALESSADSVLSPSRVLLGTRSSAASVPLAFELSFEPNEPGVLVVGGTDISLQLGNVSATLGVQGAADPITIFEPGGITNQLPYWSKEMPLQGPNSVLLGKGVASTTAFSVSATAIDSVRWFGAHTKCAERCPDGGGVHRQGLESPSFQARIAEFSYVTGHPPDAVLQGSGFAYAVLVAGPVVDTSISGIIRLPSATSADGCEGCSVISGQVLRAEGNANLDDLAPKGQRLSAYLSGDIARASLDEVTASPESLLGLPVSLIATASVAIALKFLLAPLFTRLTKEQALEHPRRKQIFEYIQQHPGANFREVARNTGIAAGTVRHHLNVLERSGQVVEHNHGSTVRLFENHGKFDQNWSDLVLLREPALGKLHDWLKAHPNSPQKAVLEAMEKEEWSRSTTQHRLSRLVDGGVASIRLQGRLKLYTVTERSVAKAPGLPATPHALPA